MWKNQIYLIWSLGVWFFFFFLDKILYKTLFTTVSVRIQEGASEYNHCTRWPRCSAKRNSGSAIQTQIWIQIQMAAYKYKFQYRYKYKNLVRCSTKRNGGSGIHVCLPALWHSLPALCSIHFLGQTVLLQLQPKPVFTFKISRFIFVKSICLSHSQIIDDAWLATRIFLLCTQTVNCSLFPVFCFARLSSRIRLVKSVWKAKVHCMLFVLQLYLHSYLKDSHIGSDTTVVWNIHLKL